MTEEQIHLTLRASPDELTDIAVRVGAQAAYGDWLRWREGLAAALGPIAGAVVAAALGANSAEAAVIGAVAVGTALVVLHQTNALAHRRYRQHLRGSALRTQPTQAVLSSKGLRVEAATYPWSGIPEIRRDKDATLLMFAPVDVFVIRDVDLPDGLPHDVLIERIGAWSSAK